SQLFYAGRHAFDGFEIGIVEGDVEILQVQHLHLGARGAGAFGGDFDHAPVVRLLSRRSGEGDEFDGVAHLFHAAPAQSAASLPSFGTGTSLMRSGTSSYSRRSALHVTACR